MRSLLVALSLSALTACGTSSEQVARSGPVQAPLVARVDAIQTAVDRWQAAPDLSSAKAAAEEARNLVLGPAGPGYGDTNGDGTVQGATDIGLLPGAHSEAGLADSGALTECVNADVLGGPWTDPVARWAEAAEAVDTWSETNNPFPTLRSHPQRIYGWASLSLMSSSLQDARLFAGHAQLHIAVTRAAVKRC